MLLNLTEIYEETIHHSKAEGEKRYLLRDVVINKQYVTFMREDSTMSFYQNEGRLPQNLAKDQKFTRISVARGNVGQDIVVCGDLQYVTGLLNHDEIVSKRKTIKG